MTTTAMSSPRTITYSSRRNAPSPDSDLSAAGVLHGSRRPCAGRADGRTFPTPHTLRQDTALPSPASFLSAAGVFARFASLLRRSRRWQNIPRPHPTPSGHGAPIARLGFVRSGRFCAVRAVPAPAAPMTEHPKATPHPVRTRRSHRPLRFYPKRAFLRGSRCSCASRADGRTFPTPHTLRQDTALPSPASFLSAAGVFARFASLLRRSRRWQNIPRPHPTPSGHGAPIARLGFVRSGRFCAVRAVPAPAAPMTEHSQSHTHSVRTRRSHRPLRAASAP